MLPQFPISNRLIQGDNLAVLHNSFLADSIDLIYADPPFHSDAIYKVGATHSLGLPEGVEAFDDRWKWNDKSESEFSRCVECSNADLGALIRGLRTALGENALTAYLVMIAARLVEMHRVLKATGSLYFHCDQNAGHYVKILLDAVFGSRNFRREIIWRSGWVSGFKTRTKNWVRNHDTIFYYVKDARADFTFNKIFIPHELRYARRGGGANPKGKAIDDVWDEPGLYSPNIKSFSAEKLGYPTQKPIALLERIIAASSNSSDVILDPFCGSGTTLDAANRLGRRWIGIDLTEIALELAAKRLAIFPVPKSHETADPDPGYPIWAAPSSGTLQPA